MPEGELLQNVICSMNPCPICLDAADEEPMTYDEWAGSEYGLPGSSGRYCEDDCHCILVPVDAMGELPEIDNLVKLRGEEGTEITSIVEIGPSEQGLKEAMEEWNRLYGKLPPEIYGMDVMQVEAYLRKLMAGMAGGPLAQVADAAMIAIREKGMASGNESLAALGDNGEMLLQLAGNKNSVDFTNAEGEAIRGAAVEIHNHPSSSSFSGQDIQHFAFLEIKKGIVVSEKFTYTVEPPAEGWGPWQDMGQAYRSIHSSLRSKYEAVYQAHKAAGMSEADAQDLTAQVHSHEVMEKLAPKYKLKYTRTGAE